MIMALCWVKEYSMKCNIICEFNQYEEMFPLRTSVMLWTTIVDLYTVELVGTPPGAIITILQACLDIHKQN